MGAKGLPMVALVGSAGGIAPMTQIVEALPADYGAAVLVVLHLTPGQPSALAAILGRHTALKVKQAQHGDLLGAATVYVGPPGAHLVLAGREKLGLDDTPPVHNVRPSADVLLRSMAENGTGALLAVVLSGTGSDGASGTAELRRAGGEVLAQDEATSAHFGMPGAAVAAGGVDRVLPLSAICAAVAAFGA